MPNPCLISLDQNSSDWLATEGTIRLKLVSTSGVLTFDCTRTTVTDDAGCETDCDCDAESLSFEAKSGTTYKLNALYFSHPGSSTANLMEDCDAPTVLAHVDATTPDPGYRIVVADPPPAEITIGLILTAGILAALCLLPFEAFAAPKQQQATCQQAIQAKVLTYQTSPTALNANDVRAYLDFNQSTPCIVAQIIRTAPERDLVNAQLAQLKLSAQREAKAYFQQNGSSTGSGGSTNLVSKSTTSQLLTLASEYGSLTQSAGGQSVTAQGSLSGIPLLLLNGGVFANCGLITVPDKPCLHTRLVDALGRASYSVAFDASQASQAISGTVAGPPATPGASPAATTQPGVFAAAAHSVNSVCAKFVMVRGASAAASDVVKAVEELMEHGQSPTGDAATEITTAALPLKADSDNWTGRKDWESAALLDLKQSAPADIMAKWAQLIAQLQTLLCEGKEAACGTKLLADALTYATAYGNYTLAEHEFIESLRKTPVLSFEYDDNRPASQPSDSTFRLVYAQPIGAGWVLTLNGAGSIYDSDPSSAVPGSGRVRDLQAAAEGAYDFARAKRAAILGNSTVSVAYYYQDQISPAILDVSPGQLAGGVVLTGLASQTRQIYARKGMINIVQGKFTLIPGKTSMRVPLSVTWSNRTELVASPVWKAQIGISYDLDSLFSGGAK